MFPLGIIKELVIASIILIVPVVFIKDKTTVSQDCVVIDTQLIIDLFEKNTHKEYKSSDSNYQIYTKKYSACDDICANVEMLLYNNIKESSYSMNINCELKNKYTEMNDYDGVLLKALNNCNTIGNIATQHCSSIIANKRHNSIIPLTLLIVMLILINIYKIKTTVILNDYLAKSQ